MAYGEAGENAKQDAGRVADAGKKTAKAGSAVAKKVKAAKAGSKAGKKAAANSLGSLAALKWKLIILGVFFLFMLLVGIITSIPSLIGNVLIHQSDPEALSDQQDITYYGTYEEDLEKLRDTAERAKEVVTTVLSEAYQSAYASISAAATVNGWVFGSEPAAVTNQTTDEAMVLLYSTYSASMKNALSDEAFEYYQETSAVDDMAEKLRALKGQQAVGAPWGNRIYGADFMRDEAGNVIVTTVEVSPAYTDEAGNVHEAEYEDQVTPIIYNVDIDDVSQAAFDVDITAVYDEEVNPYNTYADVVADMSYSIGTILFGEEFWDGSGVFFPGMLGVPNDFIVNTAYSQLGQSGGRPYWSWYGFGSRVEWCACFVSWCAEQCGYIEDGIIPMYSSCSNGVSWFKQQGRWHSRRSGYKPKPGDIIFFDWRDKNTGIRDGAPNHTGIVMSFEASIVYTIEGNSGDAVKINTYNVNSLDILGYGTPDYPEPEGTLEIGEMEDAAQ